MEASMDDQANQNDGQTSPQLPVTEYQSQGGHGEEEEESIKEEDELIAKAQKLMEKITSEPDNPRVSVLHALASILEKQEAQYMDDNGHSSSSNARASHNVGRLGSLIRENDEFFELISSKFLLETRYTTSVQAAAARLLMSCSLTWIYPHVFEESVLENIRHWVMDETVRSSTEPNLRHNTGRKQASDSEMLKTYSTGLLAVCLDGGGPVVEDVLTSGLSAKLMRYLRLRVLGETSSSHKDTSHLTESRHALGSTSMKVRDDGRGKFRQVLEPSHLDDTRMVDERSIDDRTLERDQDRSTSGPIYAEDSWDDGQPSDGLGDGADMCEVDAYGEDRWHVRDSRDGRIKFGGLDENARDDSSRRRGNHGWARSRGKGRVNEGPVDSEQVLLSPNAGSRLVQGRSIRTVLRSGDVRKVPDSKKTPVRVASGASVLARDDNDDCFQDCQIGSKDISDLVRKAVRAAEAEARAANAPDEAVKAAGDAAAEVVKTAALEELKSTNDEAAAVAAASRAALTVIDAASAIEVLRSSRSLSAEAENSRAKETEYSEDVEDYYIPDSQSVARLREKYCIQCLEMLGEYVEVLGPVLHEKGVDVCLALLQQNSKHLESSKIVVLLPYVMKLICALSAHRRFAELFVNRGGMQKLLAVPRMPQTFLGISSCLFTIGSLQGIMERVCAPPSDVAYHVVELALQLLELKIQDQAQARKNAALFFAAAFVFRAVIDAFDAQDGLQKLLSLLNDAASVRSGMNAGALGLSNSGSLRNGDRSPAEVLTSSEKQIAYHTCVALRQYFRAHLLLLMDSIRPYKTNRSAARNIPSVRAANKPLDISNEAMDAVFLQLQKDRKLGPAFVRTRWPVVEKFLAYNGHITMLELCQAPPVERYLHDLLQYALGVLHIITLVPSSRRMIVNATLSNNCVGIAVILDAANIASSYVDPEIIQPALNVLVNLVCPPPSISNKPPVVTQVQQLAFGQSSNVPSVEARDRTVEHNLPDRASHVSNQTDPRERIGESGVVDRGSAAVVSAQSINCNPQTPIAAASSGLVGDRRISLGAGAGCAGLAAQLEQGYCQAREAVRANNGIKVLLHLLQPRIYSPPTALDCLRALACRVLLGLARDNTIAHILTKLQVGKKLSELIRDSGSQTPGTEHGRWQAELNQAAIELIGIVTNSGRASTLVATDAATPTLRRIERAAIAAATPITYHSRELLLLIHEHLQASGLSEAATTLLKEAQLSPLPLLVAPSSLAQQSTPQEATSIQLQWPSGRTPSGFYTSKLKLKARDDTCMKSDSTMSSKKRILTFSSSFGSHSRHQPSDSQKSSLRKVLSTGKDSLENTSLFQSSSDPSMKWNIDADSQYKTPIVLPMKRKLSELKDIGVLSTSGKRLNAGDLGLRSPICTTPSAFHKSSQQTDAIGCCTPNSNHRSQQGRCAGDSLDDSLYSSSNLGLVTASSLVMNDGQPNNPERLTLDSLVIQYLKHQHRQCPAPITTLPPLSLLHPHVCPEPKRSLDAPSNVTARLGTREFKYTYGGVHGNRRDRQFVFSRFRPWRTCRDDDNGSLLTCVAFLGDSSHIAVGSHNGELKIFDSNSNIVVESFTGHQYPLTLIQSFVSGETQLLLSSSPHEVRLWDASISVGPAHSFEACKAARFSNYGNVFAALSSESARREILLYDIQTRQLESKLSDTFANLTVRGHVYSQIHFNPSDSMLLWNGVLWDRRVSGPVHRFDQFTDYGGGGFHPAGNEVIINSEVWDLRKFRLLRSVPSLDQTAITFNARGDVIYAILRRNIEDVMSAVHTRRVKHPLFAAFRTVDAVNYSDIATIPVDRCVLDFATEPTDSFVGLITMDDQDEMFASARIYDIGRRRPTDDDSDPDDAESEEEEEEDEDDVDEETLLGTSLGGDSESDADMINDDHHDDSVSELDDEDDGDFIVDDIDFTGERGILEIVTEDEDEDDDNSQALESLSSGEEDFTGNGFGF